MTAPSGTTVLHSAGSASAKVRSPSTVPSARIPLPCEHADPRGEDGATGLQAHRALVVQGPGPGREPTEVGEGGGVHQPEQLAHRAPQRKVTGSPTCAAMPALASGSSRRGRAVAKS